MQGVTGDRLIVLVNLRRFAMTTDLEKMKTVKRPGEFHRLFDLSYGRNEFLRAIERNAPEVMADLAKKVLPQYRLVKPKTRKECEDLKGDNFLQEPLLTALKPTLMAWAKRHNLLYPAHQNSKNRHFDTPLPFFDAYTNIFLSSLIDWDINGPRSTLKWSSTDWTCAPEFPALRDFEFRDHPWDASNTTESSFRQGLLENFQKVLEAYVKKTHRRAESKGWQPVPKEALQAHFDWLVMHRVLGKSFKTIAGEVRHPRSEVVKGIASAASLVAGSAYKRWLKA